MKTTSVKDVGSVMNLGVQAGSAVSRAGDGAFRSVWSSQTGNSKAAPQKEQYPKVQADKAGSGKAKPGDELRAREVSRKSVRRGEADETAALQDGMIGEEAQIPGEAAAMAAMELMQKIAGTFGISVESLQELMADMDLQPTDLLQPAELGNLLLEAGGAQDSLSLLTNEQLYADYRMLMEEGRAALEQSGLTPDLGQETVVVAQEALVPGEALGQPEPEKAREPVVEITVEDEDGNVPVQAAETQESQPQAVAGAQESAGGRDAGSAKQEHEDKPGDAGANLVLQAVKDELFEPQAESVQEASATQDVDVQDMMRQIMDYMRIQVKPDMSSLEMQLHPASLGTLQIQLAAKGGALTANFIAQNESVKAALESQMLQLKESFEAQGVRVEAIEVTVQTHQFEQNLEQGKGRQPQETAEGKRSRTRRINLGGEEGSNSLEETQQEESLTVRMMAANGNTVDFTA